MVHSGMRIGRDTLFVAALSLRSFTFFERALCAVICSKTGIFGDGIQRFQIS